MRANTVNPVCNLRTEAKHNDWVQRLQAAFEDIHKLKRYGRLQTPGPFSTMHLNISIPFLECELSGAVVQIC